jgi:hypothetical protein
MGSVVLILPILAFSGWLLATTGRRVLRETRGNGQWLKLITVILVGIALGWLFAFRVQYKIAPTLRLHSFPVPSLFIYQQDSKWIDSPLRPPTDIIVQIVDFAFGIAVAFLPFKIAEFFREVKAEL